MSQYFTKGGKLTEKGKRFIIHYQGAVDRLFDTEECIDLSIDELQVLQANMLELLNGKFAKRLAYKQMVIDELNKMSDQEFIEYLQEKYGSVWEVLVWSPEELARVPALKLKKK